MNFLLEVFGLHRLLEANKLRRQNFYLHQELDAVKRQNANLRMINLRLRKKLQAK